MPPSPVSGSDLADSIRLGLLVGVVAAVILFPLSVNSGADSDLNRLSAFTGNVIRPGERPARYADFGRYSPSNEARHIADWVIDSADSQGADFVLIDKKNASVLVFDGHGRLRGASAVLLGGATGDDSVPGIGTRPIDQVRPEERTTPAGRFVGERGHNSRGEDVVWVDYDAAVSMHRVLTTHPEERRLERLATPTADDNRVSWGCINVPVQFFETYISPIFAARHAVIYVLPEVKSVQWVFGSYDVHTKHAKPWSRAS